MSKPPSGFPSEPGYTGRCGASWDTDITVDGALPGDVRGKDVTHTILRVVKHIGALVPKDLEAADTLRDKVNDRIAHIRIVLQQASDAGQLAPEQVQSLNWLLKHAESHLDAVFKIHDAWLYRDDGAFPLSEGDTLGDFREGEAMFACTTLNTEGYGRYVKSGTNLFGNATYVMCPTRGELAARPIARADIVSNFTDALRSVRCAEYWLWKARLVSQAGGSTTGGPGLKPGKGGVAPELGFKPGKGTPGLGFYAPATPPIDVEPDPEGMPGEHPADPEAPTRAEGMPSAQKALIIGGIAALGAFAIFKMR